MNEISIIRNNNHKPTNKVSIGLPIQTIIKIWKQTETQKNNNNNNNKNKNKY